MVTVSIGLAERGADANSDALMRRADKALYDAEGRGAQPRDALRGLRGGAGPAFMARYCMRAGLSEADRGGRGEGRKPEP